MAGAGGGKDQAESCAAEGLTLSLWIGVHLKLQSFPDSIPAV